MPIALSNSLASAARKLNPNEARQIWTFLEKFLDNPSHPSLSLERIARIKGENLWSGRINDDLRAIVYKEGNLWTVLHVDRHNAAYNWAKTRSIERHIHTGALQIVPTPSESNILEEIEEEAESEDPPLFEQYTSAYLLSLGIPLSWLEPIQKICCKNILLNTIIELPEEVAERLLDLAEGKAVLPPLPISPDQPSIQSSDSQRRFTVLDTNQDLARMLDAPLATWVTFLHPSQKQLVIGNFKGPVKVTGVAGTGKTIVGIHRARHLARQGKRVLVTTFVTTLCRNLRHNLCILCTPEEQQNIKVKTIHREAKELLNQAGETLEIAESEVIQSLINEFHYADCPLSPAALYLEWENVIQAQDILRWDDYSRVNRAGQGQALSGKDRKQVWEIFEHILKTLSDRNMSDWAGICRRVRQLIDNGTIESPYDSVIVDELQDLKSQEIKLIAALAGKGPNCLMLLGDAGQRIYAGRSSLKNLGIDVRGRSQTLRINYRTTEQIRQFAEQIVHERDDLNGEKEEPQNTISLLRGPHPVLQGFNSYNQQIDFIIEQIQTLLQEGVSLGEIAIFSRTNNGLNAIETKLAATQLKSNRLSRATDPHPNAINLGSLHRSKGLEFKVVFLTNASDNQLPQAYLVNQMPDTTSKEAVIERERRLLYVSITRARDQVFVTWVGQPSRFLNLPQSQKVQKPIPNKHKPAPPPLKPHTVHPQMPSVANVSQNKQ